MGKRKSVKICTGSDPGAFCDIEGCSAHGASRSNDFGMPVAQEWIAAEIAAGDMTPTALHKKGMIAYKNGTDWDHPLAPFSNSNSPTFDVGWLAAAIMDHKD